MEMEVTFSFLVGVDPEFLSGSLRGGDEARLVSRASGMVRGAELGSKPDGGARSREAALILGRGLRHRLPLG